MKKISITQEDKSYLNFVKSAWYFIIVLIGDNGFNLVMDYESGAVRKPVEQPSVMNMVTKKTRFFLGSQ